MKMAYRIRFSRGLVRFTYENAFAFFPDVWKVVVQFCMIKDVGEGSYG